MVQTDLKSDNFCGFNQAASPMYWILDPIQTNLQYNVGETGVYTGVGLHTPSEVIDVSSSIVGGGRDNYLTSCNPPVPSMMSDKGNASDYSIRNSTSDHSTQGLTTQGLDKPGTDMQHLHGAKFVRKENFDSLENIENMVDNDTYIKNLELNNEMEENESKKQNYHGLIKADGTITKNIVDRAGFLQPETTTFKRSAADYSSVDWHAGFSGNEGNLFTNPQNLTHVIERMWLERGGLDQNQLIKQSREPFVHNKKPLGNQEQTCKKVRQPYNIKDPFGLPTGPEGQSLPAHQSKHFNAVDVTSVGISSPLLEQNNKVQYNYDAMYSNGGCNKVSFLKDNIMCSNMDNDLTGVNEYSFKHDMPPPGLYN